MRIIKSNAGRMHKAIAILALAAGACPVAMAQDNNQPILYRGDMQRTGRSGYAATSKPNRVWTYATGTTCSTSPVIGRDGSVYIAAYDKNVYSIDGGGALNWKRKLGGTACASGAIDSAGNVYFGVLDGKAYSLAPDGTDHWSTAFRVATGGINGSPLIDRSGCIYLGDEGGRVYAVNPNSTLKWSLQTGGLLMQSLAASPDGSVIYAPSTDGHLYALDSTGSLKWVSGDISSSGNCAVGNDGTIYAGSNDGCLYALNPSGGINWRYQTMGKITTAPAIARDGTVYFGSQDANLYAVNPNGSLKWTQRSYTSIYSAPTIDYFGTIIYGSWNGVVTALNPTNGSVKWSQTLGGTIYTSPAIGLGGTVYVVDSRGNLFGLEGPVPAGVPEPSSLAALAAMLGGGWLARKRSVRTPKQPDRGTRRARSGGRVAPGSGVHR